MQLFTKDDLEAVGAKLTGMPQRYQTVHMPGEAGSVTLPLDTFVSDKLQAAIVKRVIDVARLANTIDRVTRDQNLSDAGKLHQRRSLDGTRAELAAKLEGDTKSVGGLLEIARMAEEQFYEPAQIEPGDFATSMDDAEIRRYWAAMDPQQLERALTGGELTVRHMEALLRSPVTVKEPLGGIVAQKWERHLMENDGERFEAVNADRSSASWAVSALNQLRQAVERLRFGDATQVIRPHLEQPEAA